MSPGLRGFGSAEARVLPSYFSGGSGRKLLIGWEHKWASCMLLLTSFLANMHAEKAAFRQSSICCFILFTVQIQKTVSPCTIMR
jgi:hypothetical protein